MAKLVKPLSNIRIKNAGVRDKSYKLFDGQGLYIEITTSGSKIWRLKYIHPVNKKETRISLGFYPLVSLKDARNKKIEIQKKLLKCEIPLNPKTCNEPSKSALNSFERITDEWLFLMEKNWGKSHIDRTKSRLRNYVIPEIGDKEISQLKALDFLNLLRKIEERGNIATAHRIRAICSQIMRYAIITERADNDPTNALKGALQVVKTNHMAAPTNPKDLGKILRIIDGYTKSSVIACALRLAPLFFVRPGELRHAKWEEFDFENREWHFVLSKTKTAHIVPLSSQSIILLQKLHQYTGEEIYLFPGKKDRNRPISEMTLLSALRRLGLTKEEISLHGFRAAARTIMDEQLKERPEFIEHQLGHTVKDPLGRAYNRASFLSERKDMMQRWADYLDQLKAVSKKNEI